MNSEINVLVTGSNSQLGKFLCSIKDAFPEFNLDFLTRHDLDIADPNSIKKALLRNKYHFCINTAAYTQVDKAEEQIEECRHINATAVANLSLQLADNDISLIHISSDYVYHNDLRRPLKESDPTLPQGVYAKSKLDGERGALKNNKQTLILRTSWLYSPFGHNFIKTVLRLLKTKDKLHVVSDQRGQPTYALDLAEAILNCISKLHAHETSYGVYNFSNSGNTSWYHIAKFLKNYTGSSCQILEVTTDQYGSAGPRPLYSVLDTMKIENDFGIQSKPWKTRLTDCLELMGER